MTSVRFHPEAAAGFQAAVDYYEAITPGLGLDFADEVLASLEQVRQHPLAWPILDGDIRRCLARRFPFGILYAVQQEEILILAVMHLRRKPGYWRNRGDYSTG